MREVEDLFDRLCTPLAGDRPALYAALAAALVARFDEEEGTFLRELQRCSERDARVLAQEHRYLRRLLGEIASNPSEEAVRNLRDIVRAHHRNEERIAREWLAPHE